jgi:hypothetical protein
MTLDELQRRIDALCAAAGAYREAVLDALEAIEAHTGIARSVATGKAITIAAQRLDAAGDVLDAAIGRIDASAASQD